VHADVAVSLNNLAEIYRTQSQYGKAKPLYQRALAIREKTLGSNHPTVMADRQNFEKLYQNTLRTAEEDVLAQNAESRTRKGMDDAWSACNVFEKVLAVLLSSITAIIGLVVGWCIFPLTLAPIVYLTQSELAILGSRFSMALGGGFLGFIVPFMFLVALFGA
jgi:tetratricopeptide (TPR) repeat protein